MRQNKIVRLFDPRLTTEAPIELHATRKDSCLIYMEGDSMEPTLRVGDILLVDRRDVTAQREGIYVLRAGSTLLVKRLQHLPGHRIKASSDNPAYQPFDLDLKQQTDEFAIIGQRCWCRKKNVGEHR